MSGELKAAARELTARLTDAQRRAILNASWSDGKGVWHPEGYYCAADKRVRYRLCHMGLTQDYLRRSNRLTPLGIEVLAAASKCERRWPSTLKCGVGKR